ncbi:MAG: hypothetical protein IPG66_16370 [Hydrogenophilales bacterium]|nr:hypothetical protein [Hydrogenophilales bacterium]
MNKYRFVGGDQLWFSINKEESTFGILPDGVLDGLGLLLASLQNTNPGRTLIYVASGRGNLGALKSFITKISSDSFYHNSARKIVVLRDMDGENVEDERSAKAILEKLLKKWNEAYPDFHTNPWVDNGIKRMDQMLSKT